MIRTVLFDLDDTLFDFGAAEHTAICDTLSHLGIEPSKETVHLYVEINLACWKRLERGECTRDEVLYSRFNILFSRLGIERDSTEAKRYYERRLAEEVCYMEGAEELLSSLRGKYRMYIVSNGTALVQDRRIELSGIAKYFDGIFISERVGHHKPSPAFFDAVFRETCAKRCETVITGDSLTSDIQGGINAGITTILYNPKQKDISGDILPDYQIKSLGELPRLLEAI